MGPRLVLPDHVRALYPFESRWYSCGGYTLHYVHEGPRKGPYVLLLHGNPTWSFIYRDFIPPLVEAGCQVVAPDYLGFGLSDKPSDEGLYAIQHHIGRLIALIDSLEIESVVVFAQDWGGPIAMGAGIERPGLIAGMVLSNTFWGEQSSFQRSVPMWRALHAPVAGSLLLGRRGLFVNALKLSAPRDMPEAAWDGYTVPFADASSRTGTLAFPRAISTGAGHPTQPLADAIREQLPRWDIPARLPWGSADAVFPPDEQGARFAELLPRATGVEPIEGARHFVQEYASGICVDAIRDVVKEAFG